MELPDIIRSGLRKEDLVGAPDWVDPLLRYVNGGIQTLTQALSHGLSRDNLASEFQTVNLTHGVPQLVSLKRLRQARAIRAVSVGSADNKTRHILAVDPQIVGTAIHNQVKVICYFCDSSAVRVPVTLEFLPEGNYCSITPVAPVRPGWNTVLDLDFTAQASQTLNTDGNYTIAGLSFKKENSANDNVAMALTNGAGLVIQPKTTGDYVGATRTCPLLWLQLSQLGIPGLAWSTGFRVWIYISAANYAANFDNNFVGIDGDNMNYSFAAFRGIGGAGAAAMTYRNTFNGVSVSGTAPRANDSGNNVILVEKLALAGIQGGNMYYGSYSAGWPAVDGVSYGQGVADAAGAAVLPAAAGPAAGNSVKNYGVVLGAMRAGSGTALSITIARLRIDFHL